VDNLAVCGTAERRWKAVHAAEGVVQTSDTAAKDVLKDLPYGLDELDKVRTVVYRWKGQTDPAMYYGVCADELVDLFPELVYTTQRPYQLNYAELVPVLINAVKQLNAKVRALTPQQQPRGRKRTATSTNTSPVPRHATHKALKR
jgi:hypothetical protein